MINKLLSRSLRGQLAITGGAILLALVVGAVIMVLTSPIITGSLDLWLWVDAYLALIQGATGIAISLDPISVEFLGLNGVIDTLVRATPYILGGLAVGLGFKAGLFNIGAQGQFLMGALGAVTVGVLLADASSFVAVPLALLAGVAAGAAYGFVPGWLKAYTGAHEVVVTIMLNYVALAIVSWAVTGPLRSATASFARTDSVGHAALPILGGSSGHLLHSGVLIAFLAVPIVWWILYRTTIGFEVRTVGANPDAARYAGMRPRLLITGTMAAGGPAGGPRRRHRDPGRAEQPAGDVRHDRRLRCHHGGTARTRQPVGHPLRRSPARRAARRRAADADRGRGAHPDDRHPAGRHPLLPRC